MVLVLISAALVAVGFVVMFNGALAALASDPCGPDSEAFICTGRGQSIATSVGTLGGLTVMVGSLIVAWLRRRTFWWRLTCLVFGFAGLAAIYIWLNSLSP